MSPRAVHYVAFSMRNLRADLHARLRVIATVRSQRADKLVTMESVVNDVLLVGLVQIEKEELK